MQKKVFIIILPIAFFIFYGCSSMKHSTIVLYVSRKVEAPLYMPSREPPVTTQAPQTESVASQRGKSSQTNQGQGRRPTRGQANQNQQSGDSTQTSQQDKKAASGSKTTQESQANQSGQPAQANQGSSKPVKESQKSTENKANQGSEPAKTSQDKKAANGSKTTQESQANQNNQPAKTSQASGKPTRGSQTSTPEKQATQQESKPSRESQPTEKKPSRESKDNQNNQITNTYGDYTMRTLPRGEFLVLEKPIRFAFEKYYIGSSYDDTVKYVADFMKQNTNFQLVVEGHTDRVGEYRFNKNLSLRRSRAAIQKLVRAGVPKNRLIESGVSYRFSEYNFNRLNRRVEFIIIRSPEDITNYRAGIK